MTVEYDKNVFSALCNLDLNGHRLADHIVISVWNEEKNMGEIMTVDDDGAVKKLMDPGDFMLKHSLLRAHLKNCNVLVYSDMPYTALWAKQREALPTISLLHARYFLGDVNFVEIADRSDAQTVIDKILTLYKHKLPEHVPAAFLADHGVITWGNNIAKVVEQAAALEMLSKSSYFQRGATASCYSYLPADILYQEFFRNHDDPDGVLKHEKRLICCDNKMNDDRTRKIQK